MTMSKIDFSQLNLQDALDLAALIEKEAFERYSEFADLLGNRYDDDAGAFFKTMAGYELEHANLLKARREKLFGKTPSRITMEIFWDIEAPSSGDVRSYMSPQQAMELALSSEVKAYNFFNQALRSITNSDVKTLFEELRDEELEHQNLLIQRIAKTPSSIGPDLTEDDVDEPGEY